MKRKFKHAPLLLGDRISHSHIVGFRPLLREADGLLLSYRTQSSSSKTILTYSVVRLAHVDMMSTGM